MELDEDTGDIFLDGKPFKLNSPEEAPKFGISTVYQEINLIITSGTVLLTCKL